MSDVKIKFSTDNFDMPTEKKYAVKDVVEGIEYEFRVAAINISGAGEPSAPSEFVIARDPKSEFLAINKYVVVMSMLNRITAVPCLM